VEVTVEEVAEEDHTEEEGPQFTEVVVECHTEEGPLFKEVAAEDHTEVGPQLIEAEVKEQ
jgi:hypothetical protein